MVKNPYELARTVYWEDMNKKGNKCELSVQFIVNVDCPV